MPFWYEFFAIRRDNIRWFMMEHFRKLPAAEKKDYGEIIIRELLALAKEEFPPAVAETYRGIQSDFQIIVRETHKEFEEVDKSLADKLKKEFGAYPIWELRTVLDEKY